MIKIDINTKLKIYYSYALIDESFYQSEQELNTRKFREQLPANTLFAFFGDFADDFEIEIYRKGNGNELTDEKLWGDHDEEALSMVCNPEKFYSKMIALNKK